MWKTGGSQAWHTSKTWTWKTRSTLTHQTLDPTQCREQKKLYIAPSCSHHGSPKKSKQRK
eukprot:8997664-Ditylum_brightwellii.AAC.1